MTLPYGRFLWTASTVAALALIKPSLSEEVYPVDPPRAEEVVEPKVESKMEEPKTEESTAPIEVQEPATAVEPKNVDPAPAANQEPSNVSERPTKQDESNLKKKKKSKKVKLSDETTILQPVVEPTPEHTAQVLLEKAREQIVLEEKLHKNIWLLTTPGWKDAQKELVAAGRNALPLLVAALCVQDEPQDGEYPLETYTLTSAGRPTYSRPLKDVVFEVLDNMVRNHSDWKGAVPGRDQKAWQEFWSANSGSIAFGR